MNRLASGATSLEVAARLHALLRAERQTVLDYAVRHIPADLRSLIDPQDVLQDTFLEAFRRLAEFDTAAPDSPRRWLLTIARTRIINLIRARRTLKRGGRAKDILADLAAEALPGLLEELAVYERTPSQSAIAHEVAALIETLLASAPQDDQTVLRLKYFDQMPVAQIAIRLGRSEGAIHMLCARAIERLRQAIDQSH